jgi:hypothetical protein
VALRASGAGQFEETIRNGKLERKPLTRFHDLRHTFGTRMAAAGVPMRSLQEWMGHRDLKTTLIYADYAPSSHEAQWVNQAFEGNGEQPRRRAGGSRQPRHSVWPQHATARSA